MVAPLSRPARHCAVQAGHPESPYPTRALFFSLCLLKDFSKLHHRLASRQVPGCGIGQRIFKRTLCIYYVRAPSPQEPSSTEDPVQNTVGVLLKVTWLANWATHLVRFKIKRKKKKSSPSLPPAYIPIPGVSGVGVGQPVGTFKKLPPWFWVLPGLELGSSELSLGRTHLHAALRLLTHLSTRGAVDAACQP